MSTIQEDMHVRDPESVTQATPVFSQVTPVFSQVTPVFSQVTPQVTPPMTRIAPEFQVSAPKKVQRPNYLYSNIGQVPAFNLDESHAETYINKVSAKTQSRHQNNGFGNSQEYEIIHKHNFALTSQEERLAEAVRRGLITEHEKSYVAEAMHKSGVDEEQRYSECLGFTQKASNVLWAIRFLIGIIRDNIASTTKQERCVCDYVISIIEQGIIPANFDRDIWLHLCYIFPTLTVQEKMAINTFTVYNPDEEDFLFALNGKRALMTEN
jgi:hypothetical protein